MAVRVRYNSCYISLPSSAKQQHKIIKFLRCKCFALSQIPFRDGFDTKKQREMTLEYREVRGLNIKSLFNRRCPRRHRCSFLNSLSLFTFVKFVTSR